MKREELKKLVNSILDNVTSCNVTIDVWYPTIKEVKHMLSLGHDKISPNSNEEDNHIFNVKFDNYDSCRAPALSTTLFCKTPETAEFMRKYYKEKGGDTN